MLGDVLLCLPAPVPFLVLLSLTLEQKSISSLGLGAWFGWYPSPKALLNWIMEWGLNSSGVSPWDHPETRASFLPLFSPQQKGRLLFPGFYYRTASLHFHPSPTCCLSLWLPGYHDNKVPMVTKKSCCIPTGSAWPKEKRRPLLSPGHKKRWKRVSAQGVLDRSCLSWCLQAGPWTKCCCLHSNSLFTKVGERHLALAQVHCFA